MDDNLYSVVIPVYKSEKILPALYEKIKTVFNKIQVRYELILVDDCSSDNSWKVMKSIHQKDSNVKIVSLMKNFGQHNALICGFAFARGNYIITMDDDLQNPPDQIPKLIDAVKSTDMDVVYGMSRSRKHSAFRKLGSRIFYRFISFIFNDTTNCQISNFRIIKKSVVDSILEMPTPNPIVGLMTLGITDRIGYVDVRHDKRYCGKTTYSWAKLIGHFLNGILYHSAFPLKAVFCLGLVCFGVSFILGIYYLINYIRGIITVSGWTTLVLLTLMFSGIIMLSLGIVGEYLFRIIQEVHNRPQYIIREKEL